MAHFIFRYGVMNSSKTLNLISTVFNYESQGKHVIVIKPQKDTRSPSIQSRAGLKVDADIVVEENLSGVDLVNKILRHDKLSGKRENFFLPKAVIADEVNFLTYEQVKSLTMFTDILDVPVMVYGLKTDFRNKLFPGSQAAIEWADKIEEIKTICHEDDCTAKATINMRLVNGKAASEGEQIFVGDVGEGKVTYKPVCRKCYRDALKGK